PQKLIRPAPQLAAKAAAAAAKAAPKKAAPKKAAPQRPAAAAQPAAVEVAPAELEGPAELLNKPFKKLTKQEPTQVSRARSRAMRAKAGVPVASKTQGAPAAQEAEEAPAPAEAVERPGRAAPVAASAEVAADPMAEVPPELLAKPFKDLTKEERIIVSRARSRAMRAKAGLPMAGPGETAARKGGGETAPEAVFDALVEAVGAHRGSCDPKAGGSSDERRV